MSLVVYFSRRQMNKCPSERKKKPNFDSRLGRRACIYFPYYFRSSNDSPVTFYVYTHPVGGYNPFNAVPLTVRVISILFSRPCICTALFLEHRLLVNDIPLYTTKFAFGAAVVSAAAAIFIHSITTTFSTRSNGYT